MLQPLIGILYYTSLKSFRIHIGIYAAFWNDILHRADCTNQSLQDPKLDLNTAVASLHSLKSFVASKRDSFQAYQKQGEELAGSSEFGQSTGHFRRRSSRLQPLDYGRAVEADMTPAERYRAGKYGQNFNHSDVLDGNICIRLYYIT